MDRNSFEGKTYTPDQPAEWPEAAEFTTCVFEGCDLTKVPLAKARFQDCRFENCNFSNVRLSGVSLEQVRFNGCKMTGADFSVCNSFLISGRFENCILSFCLFKKLPLRETVFKNCEIREADFSGADLSSSSFAGCDLSGAIFDRTNLEKADLRSARNFSIDPVKNRVRKAKFSWPGVMGLLAGFGISVGPEEVKEKED